MRTIRAKDLTVNSILSELNEKVQRVDITRRGNIMVWLGEDGTELKFFNPMDVVVIE